MTPTDLTDAQESMMQEKDDADLMWAVSNLYHPGSLRTIDLMQMIEKELSQHPDTRYDTGSVVEAVFDWLGWDATQIAAAARWRLDNPDYEG